MMNRFHSAATAALLTLLLAKSSHAVEAAPDRSVYPGLPRFLTLTFQQRGSGTAMEPPQELSDYLETVETRNVATILAYASEQPSYPFAADALLEAARLLLSRGDSEGGAELLQKVWSSDRDDVRLDQTYRQFAGRGKIYPEEIERYESYRKHIGRYPNLTSDLAMVELGQLRIKLGKLESAYRVLGQVIERYPEGQFSSEDKEEKVVVCYDPQRPLGEALWCLAEVARLRGKEGDYRRCLLRIVDLYPGSARGQQAFDALCAYWESREAAGKVKALGARRLEVLKGLVEAAEGKGLRLRAAEYRLEINRIGGDNEAEDSGVPGVPGAGFRGHNTQLQEGIDQKETNDARDAPEVR